MAEVEASVQSTIDEAESERKILEEKLQNATDELNSAMRVSYTPQLI